MNLAISVTLSTVTNCRSMFQKMNCIRLLSSFSYLPRNEYANQNCGTLPVSDARKCLFHKAKSRSGATMAP